MSTATDTHPLYAHRRADAIVLNTTIDFEAFEVLRTYCPAGRRSTGKFLARLLFEHDARMRERQRQRHLLDETPGGPRGEADED